MSKIGNQVIKWEEEGELVHNEEMYIHKDWWETLNKDEKYINKHDNHEPGGKHERK